MPASSDEGPALDNRNDTSLAVHDVYSPYLIVKKYSSLPQIFLTEILGIVLKECR